MTIDGTDFKIWEPAPFSKLWYSHKFRSAGLRYEVGICIQTGDIVWVNGPFKCGRWNDLCIFRNDLKQLLLPNELVEADNGYRGDRKVRTAKMAKCYKEYRKKKEARARHETVNGRFKNWGVLNQVFRHSLNLHHSIFMAIATLTQLCFEHGQRPYQVDY